MEIQASEVKRGRGVALNMVRYPRFLKDLIKELAISGLKLHLGYRLYRSGRRSLETAQTY